MHYGTPGAAAGAFGQMHVTPLAFPAVLERLREAIGAEGLWVLHEIDPQAILARDGHAIGPARQILFFHPDSGGGDGCRCSAAMRAARRKFSGKTVARGSFSRRLVPAPGISLPMRPAPLSA